MCTELIPLYSTPLFHPWLRKLTSACVCVRARVCVHSFPQRVHMYLEQSMNTKLESRNFLKTTDKTDPLLK